MTERFTLLDELGRGGMGVVWRARDEETGRIVALKLLREAYAEDPSYIGRFERELELARRINSTHVVKVLGYGVREGTPYLALEYVNGPSLHDLLVSHGPYGWADTKALMAQLTQGLADAHAAGVIHRDVKPSNVLMAPDGTAKLTDFGIARGLDLTRVTATSAMLGTPAYLAPEGPKDARADLYSLGIIGYELLTGDVPFTGTSYQEIIVEHVSTPPDLTRLPAEAQPIIGWLLAKDPAERPQSAGELLSALTAQGQPVFRQSNTTHTYAQASVGYPMPVSRAAGHRQRAVLASLGVIAFVVVLGAAGLVIMTSGKSGPTTAPRASSSAAGQSTAGGITQWQWTDMAAAPANSGGTLVALSDGRLLGLGQPGTVYDPVANAWSSANAPDGTNAIAMADDLVLIWTPTGTKSAYLYDAKTDSSTSVPTPSVWGKLVLLSDGRVLNLGGLVSGKVMENATLTSTVEAFDPKTRSWANIGQLSVAMTVVDAVALSDGRVMVFGENDQLDQLAPEIFDPTTGTATAVPGFRTDAWSWDVRQLADGRVALLAEIMNSDAIIYYDLATGNWSDPVQVDQEACGSRIMLANGNLFYADGGGMPSAAGGCETGDGEDSPPASAAIRLFDLSSNSFGNLTPMHTARMMPLLIELAGGYIVVMGGEGWDAQNLKQFPVTTMEILGPPR
jgi:serine/threonine-protein kinase